MVGFRFATCSAINSLGDLVHVVSYLSRLLYCIVRKSYHLESKV